MQKKIRLIELFSGYGSQAMALRNIGADFETYRISEWYIPSIKAYHAVHSTDTIDYSADYTLEEIKDKLKSLNLSADSKTPVSEKYYNKYKEDDLRSLYNINRQVNNLGSITEIKGTDLAILEKDKYCYLLTYSFPCQDISFSGRRAGFEKGSETRSSLLWEVARLLQELSKEGSLPQVLFMENVKAIISKTHKVQFDKWISALNDLGYSSYYAVLNAKDYDIPQQRERCFMFSFLRSEMDIHYEFPKPKATKPDIIQGGFLENCVLHKQPYNLNVANELIAELLTRVHRSDERTQDFFYTTDNILVHMRGRNPEKPSDRRRGQPFKQRLEYSTENLSCCLTSFKKDNLILERLNSVVNSEEDSITNYRLRYLTTRESFRLMGVSDEDIGKITNIISSNTCLRLASNSIVVSVMEVMFKQLLKMM